MISIRKRHATELFWTFLLPIAGGISAFLMVAQGALRPSSEDLSAFFGVALQVLATGLVAFALISMFPAKVGHVLLRPLSLGALSWLTLGAIASIAGALDLELGPFGPVLLAATLSSLLVFLTIVLRVAVKNIRSQSREAEIQLAKGPATKSLDS